MIQEVGDLVGQGRSTHARSSRAPGLEDRNPIVDAVLCASFSRQAVFQRRRRWTPCRLFRSSMVSRVRSDRRGNASEFLTIAFQQAWIAGSGSLLTTVPTTVLSSSSMPAPAQGSMWVGCSRSRGVHGGSEESNDCCLAVRVAQRAGGGATPGCDIDLGDPLEHNSYQPGNRSRRIWSDQAGAVTQSPPRHRWTSHRRTGTSTSQASA